MSGKAEYSAGLPGSDGEHELQECYGTSKRARAFYSRQMLDHLNEEMREFIARQEMVFVSTADAGVDLVNTDDLAGLQKFLLERKGS